MQNGVYAQDMTTKIFLMIETFDQKKYLISDNFKVKKVLLSFKNISDVTQTPNAPPNIHT